MASQSDGEEKRSIIDTIKEDRYVLIMAIAVLIFIASSSLALMNSTRAQFINPVPFFSAQVNGNTVELSWGASSTPSVSGYDVYRSTAPGVLGTKLNSAPLQELTYNDTASPGTYYYTVRALSATGEDSNADQLTVIVADKVPTGLTIAINNGANYTSTQSVALSLSASGATYCRYKNDEDLDWSPWEQYATEKSWTLSSGPDGERIVAYQCENTGESGIAIAKITLDTTPPSLDYLLSTSNGQVQVSVFAEDLLSTSITCNVSTEASQESFSMQLSADHTGTHIYTKALPKGEHSLSMSCSDDAGNIKDVPAQKINVQ
ncbi:MAG: hypothetical protein PHS02_03170 [Candidatus ainarchaeum sp.]|nr:hypothetical protein [Candidatus ainarchaeum sp.]